MKRTFYHALLAMLLLAAEVAYAVDPIYTAVFSNKAIRGYDTVAYFVEGRAIEGNEQFSTKYQDATWLFSSQQNLNLFLEAPEKYAPQYGGYCAYAVSQNKTASIQPELFTIYNDKLYLNYSQNINQKWLADKDQFIIDADQYWPKLLQD